MKNNTRFFKFIEDKEDGWLWNGYPVELLGGKEV